MICTLHNWLALWLRALRRIVELHPAVFSVGVNVCYLDAFSAEQP